jgi:hypothetical protein
MRPNRQYTWAFLVVSGMLLSGCAAMSKGQADLDLGMKQRGIASWYGDDFHGRTTASGELYDMHALTAAHRTLPLGTVVRIVNVRVRRLSLAHEGYGRDQGAVRPLSDASYLQHTRRSCTSHARDHLPSMLVQPATTVWYKAYHGSPAVSLAAQLLS